MNCAAGFLLLNHTKLFLSQFASIIQRKQNLPRACACLRPSFQSDRAL